MEHWKHERKYCRNLLYKARKGTCDKHEEKWKKNGQKQVRRLQQTYVEHVGKMTKTQRNIFFETAEIPNPQNMTKNR